MQWQEFLISLSKEYRLSMSEIAEKAGLSVVAVYKIARGETLAPTQNTISKIESALGIKIDDSDPQNITYAKVTTPKNLTSKPEPEKDFNNSYQIMEWELPIFGDIPAGLGEFNGYHQTETVTLDSRRQFMLRVDRQNGESMVPLLRPGDLVVCELGAKVRPGDIVAAKWGNNQAAIKLYGDNSKLPGTVILESYNRATDLVILNVDKELLTIAKVVHIIKAK